MAIYDYPSSADLRTVAQVLIPNLTKNRVAFQLMPLEESNTSMVIWEQMDDYRGLQNIRGMDGAPGRVANVGGKRYSMKPGVYGDFTTVDEMELTERRQFGTFGQPVKIGDLVQNRQNLLLGRELNLIETNIWTLLTTGSYAVANPAGQTLITDTFPIQTFTAGTPWATSATATPLANFRAIQTSGPAVSTDFGPGAVAYMNRFTYNYLITNSNPADLYGRRAQGLATINNLKELNQLLTGDNLPTIQLYDKGFENDSGSYVRFLPTGKVVVVGARDDASVIGKYMLTRNANNPDGSPGSFSKVIDKGEDTVPRTIEVHRGHNGGPAIFFPGSVYAMNV